MAVWLACSIAHRLFKSVGGCRQGAIQKTIIFDGANFGHFTDGYDSAAGTT